jgi:hypothetical protein
MLGEEKSGNLSNKGNFLDSLDLHSMSKFPIIAFIFWRGAKSDTGLHDDH